MMKFHSDMVAPAWPRDLADWQAALAGYGVKRISSREIAAACPLCGMGRDRLHIRQERGRVIGGCRQCTDGRGAEGQRRWTEICRVLFPARDRDRASDWPEPARDGAGARGRDASRAGRVSEHRPGPERRSSAIYGADGTAEKNAHGVTAGPYTRREEIGNRFAGRIWEAGGTAGPVLVYLAGRGAWPPDRPLPHSVRWLARDACRQFDLRGFPDDAAGAVIYAFGNPASGALAAVQLDALSEDGRLPARRWRRTHGAPKGAAFPALAPGADPGEALHVAEGPVDALAIATWRGRQAWAGGGTAGLLPLAPALANRDRPIVIEADGDGPGWRDAMALQDAMIARNRTAHLESWPGCDPAEGLAADWEERAAILEYDGGMARAEAERRAWEAMQ
ncbi:MAG: toprim domain-containing protein [Alphaproteobacteria bacterium]|nr:toprim domain-containing protein [Alphaproteobacteria bacterium]